MREILFYTYCILMLFSCSKEAKNVLPDQQTKLTFTVEGGMSLDKVAQLASTKESIAENFKVLDTIKIDGRDAVITLHTQDVLESEIEHSKTAGLPAPISSNVKYRVLVYKESDNTFVGYIDGNADGTDDFVNVQARTKFKWYAYSYNSINAITDTPPVSGSSSSAGYLSKIVNPNYQTSNNSSDMLLWASGSVETNVHGVETPVKIIFKRKHSRIRLQFDGVGLTAFMRGGKVTLNTGVLKSGQLNVITGKPTAISYYNSQITRDGLWEVSSDNNRTYTDFNTLIDSTATSMTFTAKLERLMVTRDKNEARTSTLLNRQHSYSYNDAPSMTFTIPGSSMSNTIKWAKLYIINVTFIPSPAFVSSTGLKWAREDLYYDPVLGHNLFRYDNPTHTTASRPSYYYTDYYRWNSKTAQDRVNNTGDPCATVKPINTWRLPTEAEYSELFNDINTYTKNIYINNGVNYVEIANMPLQPWSDLWRMKESLFFCF